MKTIVLKDNTEIKIENGDAKYGSVLVNNENDLANLIESLTLDNLSEFTITDEDGYSAKFFGGISRVIIHSFAAYPCEVDITIDGKSDDGMTTEEKASLRTYANTLQKNNEELTIETNRIQPYVTKAVQFLDDEDSLEMKSYFPEWSGESVAYKTGEKVRYNDILYKVLQDHTSQEGWNPEDAPSLFAEVLVSEDGTILPWKQPDSTNPYMKDDKVLYPGEDGDVWVSMVDNNVWEPGIYGWTKE